MNTLKAFKAVGLDETFYNRYAFQLSGGQQERASIERITI
jgi:ABC-type oligopeptide transport system ATPase subunit